jgi:hypothetical protein
VAGDAEREIAQDFARLFGLHIRLADMRAVAAEFYGEGRAVVEQEGGIARLRDGAQPVDGFL